MADEQSIAAAALKKFDEFVFSKMSQTRIPSLTTAVVSGEEIVHSRAFGFKDVEAAIPTGLTTLYGIGSVTKSFTAFLICKLAEEGKLDFHDPVTKYIPALGKTSVFEKIEIHHLLSHSSGLPGLGYAEVQIFGALGKSNNWLPISSMRDMENFLDRVEEWKEAEPGSKFYYLNEGYFILGEIIERVSGKPYYHFLKQKILEPLEMKRTFISKTSVESDGDYATPYWTEDGKIERSKIPWGSGAAGGIMSNVLDLSNYIEMYIGRGGFKGRRIIGEEMINKMETPYSRPPVSVFRDASYGYGFFLTRDFFGEKLVRHDGSISVYTAGIAYIPDKQVGISLLCNGSGYPPNMFCLYALTILCGKDPEKDYSPFVRERILESLEGTYVAYKGTIKATVKRNGDFLLLSGEDVGSHILVPVDNDAENLKEAVATFYTLRATARLQVEFRLKGEQGIELMFERYKYRKVGQ